jgi:hypothetical protein
MTGPETGPARSPAGGWGWHCGAVFLRMSLARRRAFRYGYPLAAFEQGSFKQELKAGFRYCVGEKLVNELRLAAVEHHAKI